jgi:hypothetical protein
MPAKKSGSNRTKSPKRSSGVAAVKSKKSSRALAPAPSKGKTKRPSKTKPGKKGSAAAAPFIAQFFPLSAGHTSTHEYALKPQTSGANFVGVCFSGGGSRALSAAMGQLRGLKFLGLADDIFFISSVSGGTWASAAYTYLPAHYQDDDFLGLTVVNPGNLTLLNTNPSHPEYALDYLSPNNLGRVPASLSVFGDIGEIWKLKEKYNYPNSQLWQGLIGNFVLNRWKLWSADTSGFPTRYYSYTPAYLGWKGGILDRNKQLKATRFFCVERKRPFYVMNGCIVSNPLTPGSQLLPFESTGVGIGVRQYFPGVGPQGRGIGGGLVEPFAMGSNYMADVSSNYASVSVPARPFSLSDMVSISSAAFAEMLQSEFPRLAGLIPKYRYWPVTGRSPTAGYDYEFADGGSLEDTGITSLLNRNLPNIIAFVNGMTPLSKDSSGKIVIDSQIQLLFGKQPSAASLKYKEPLRQDVPNNDVTFTQVFDGKYYDELAKGLWAANSAPYNGTAMYMQTLPVLPNTNFGIQGNYNVRVLWVTNTWVHDWYELLNWEVGPFAVAENELAGFPNYNTFTHLDLSSRQVNLLAQLSCWNVISNNAGPQGGNADLMRKMFYG